MARARHLKLQVLVLGLVIGALALTAVAPARQALSQRRAIREEQQRLAALTRANTQLEQRLARLNDPDYLEKLAREQLGLVRPDEIAFVVVPPDPVTSTVKAPPPPSKPWYQRLGDWVSGLWN